MKTLNYRTKTLRLAICLIKAPHTFKHLTALESVQQFTNTQLTLNF